MVIRTYVKKILDGQLLQHGILSSHLQRVKAQTAKGKDGKTVKINEDEYVVYRIVSSNARVYGGGVPKAQRVYVDVNYYYAYDKDNPRTAAVEARIKDIIAAFLTDKHFTLANGQSDLYDTEPPYRGINIEFAYFGAMQL